MKLALVSMIRDEVDILPAFLQHVSALFGMGFLLDQRSSDGSEQIMEEFCRGSPGWRYFKLDFAGRHQREVSNIFMERAFEAGADAVVFLDADEFISCTKRELYSRIHSLIEESKIGLFRWIPCVPKRFCNKDFELDQPLYIAPHPSLVPPKVVITRQIFFQADGILRVRQANHAIEGDRWPTQYVGGIYHVPIRSRQQLFRKAVIGSISHFARGNLMGSEGFQKKDMLDMIAARQLTGPCMRGMAAYYTEKPGEPARRRGIDLEADGFQLKKLKVARSQKRIPRPKAVNDYVVVANSLRDAQIEIPDEATFTICENVVRLNSRYLPFADVPEMRSVLERFRTELSAERQRAKFDREKLQSKLSAEQARAKSDLEFLQSKLAAEQARAKSDLEFLQSKLTAEKERAKSDVEHLRSELRSLLASRSWRLTAPLRAVHYMASRAASLSTRTPLTMLFRLAFASQCSPRHELMKTPVVSKS